ncbi:AAA family ATPase [Amycolatopsis sp. NPDC051903]|uniref:helix-turn-helix transcriptional regulator n=1 Tax=Amycolatopsis sp. NPDC051903 TaxID=3363936 RepID=UPI00378E2618
MSELSAATAEPGSAVIGRREDLRRVKSLLPAAGGAVLLTGAAGVGKSVVLDAIAETEAETGTLVLRAAGVQFEADIAYSGLNQALFPLLGVLGALEGTHREVLDVALGLTAGRRPDRLLVANAAIALLRGPVAERHVLLVVDDLPWIDRASATVFGLMARRLPGTGVGFLGAMRTGADEFFGHSGLPAYELPPLDEEAAQLLVGLRFPALADRVRDRLLDSAKGNPLALLELPTALTAAQQLAHEEVPEVLPLSERLQDVFAGRIAGLADTTRRLLLAAALDGTGQLGVLQSCALLMGGRPDLAEFAPAERAQLVQVDTTTRRLLFRHPLIRSAVVTAATSFERRAAHRALAGALADQPERRAWHLGEASLEPDEEVATLLQQAAHLILERGSAAAAVAALTRAAELSPEPAARARRLAEAAYLGTESAGRMHDVRELLEDARRAAPGVRTLHSAAAAAFLLLSGDGTVETAHRLLLSAIEAGDHKYDGGDPTLAAALDTLLLLSYYAGRSELWDLFNRVLGRVRPAPPPLMTVAARLFGNPAGAGAATVGELEALLARAPRDADLARINRLGSAAVYTDRLGEIRQVSWQVVRQGRRGGPVRRQLGAMMQLCLDNFLTGRWDECDELTGEALALCAEHGYEFLAWYYDYNRALVAGARGDQDTSARSTARMIGWAAPRGVKAALDLAGHARTVAALARADFDRAYDHATAVSPAGRLEPHTPHALWVMLDLVEAAVRTRRDAEAAAHLRAMRDSGVSALSPRLALHVHAAEALCARSDREAVERFEEALAIPDVDRWQFDAARVRLAYGERLRRARSTALSRGQLLAASEVFDRLGARPWAERTAKELRAAGWSSSTGARTGLPVGALTAQEREIARLAASGLTNKQIAEKLYLSHRTVGAHLYQIFPKLGVTSRAALRDALAAVDD